MNAPLLHPRIAVVGIGGVGGYLSAMLAHTYHSVTVVARGKRREAIEARGLVLHSDLNGEIVSHPCLTLESAADLTEQDYLFICVKNYSLEELLPQLDGAVTDNTIIVPVMNGVDPGDRVGAAIKKGTVVKSLIYIVSYADTDYSIRHQGQFADIRFGLDAPSEADREKLQSLSSLLTHAGIRNKIAEDITLAIWKKYVLNCAFNVETAYYDTTIGPLRDDPAKAAEYEALIHEACQVGLAKGIPLTKQDADDMIDRFYHSYDSSSSSSLQRDLHAGKKAEVETFSGYIVREAKALGVSVPVSLKMYAGLCPERPA